MSGTYEDSWAKTLGGPWTRAMERSQEPCHYGCGKPAAMREPGRPWKAHKVCAEDTQSTGPLGSWNGEEHKVAADGPIGCGTAPAGATGRWCAGHGDRPSCVLCPRSPSYWNPGSPVAFHGHIEGEEWEPPMQQETAAPVLASLPLRADWEQALLRERWPGGVPFEYRKKAEEYAAQYEELLAEAIEWRRSRS